MNKHQASIVNTVVQAVPGKPGEYTFHPDAPGLEDRKILNACMYASLTYVYVYIYISVYIHIYIYYTYIPSRYM